MERADVEHFVRQAVRIVLQRTPSPSDFAQWCELLDRLSPADFLIFLENQFSDPQRNKIHTHWKNGHYYSPVVDPDQSVRHYWENEQRTLPAQIAGIELDVTPMIDFWCTHAEFLLNNPFPDHADGTTRYCNINGTFPGGDAVFLGAMMRTYSPKNIIEIGSGNSTACMLDWADRMQLSDLHITCIEPDPIRLMKSLRDGDNLTVIPKLVQDIDLNVFRQLNPGDILFIDSTHVLKTASDVHFELFHILPILAEGVVIHFHDCAFPFEYPSEAIFDMNFSWNEAYAIRAFLMYNQDFRVKFWNSMFYRFCPPEMRQTFGTLSKNPGGGLWLEKTSAKNLVNSDLTT